VAEDDDEGDIATLESLAARLTPQAVTTLLYTHPERTRVLIDRIIGCFPKVALHDHSEVAGNPAHHGSSAEPQGPRTTTNGPDTRASKPAAPRQTPIVSDLEKLPKNRKAMAQETVILGFIDQAGRNRAVSNDQIEGVLRRAGFGGIGRPSLVTKLNRMKTVGSLAWDDGSRGKDVRITDGGRQQFQKLRDRYLSTDDLDLLKANLPELFT